MAHSIEITSIDNQTPLLLPTENNEIEEGRKMDHSIETNQILIEIDTDLRNSATKSCTIFKVTLGLSESNPDAYTPQLVSIGPYHSNNPQLRSMETYKLRYLQRFLQRKTGIDLERCIRELKMLKDDALKSYDGIKNLYSNHNTDQFLKILVLDGCFVVEFIRERCGMKPYGEDMIVEVGCIYNQVVRDMLLLENQLPFFVLTKLHDMTMDQRPFIEMVKETFDSSLLKMHPSSFIETEGDARNIKHLLHLVHMSCQPFEKKTNQTENLNLEAKYFWKRCWNPFENNRLIKMIPAEDKDHHAWDANMPNATDLHEAGVRFSKVGKNNISSEEDGLGDNYTSLFDIKFENGLIKIPSLDIFDYTEAILRNLIAYEQLSLDVHHKYFSDFSIFMDYLIDSDKDVCLLRKKGIIKKEIGEDKEVASFFNKIGKGVSMSSNFYYKEECRKLVKHCEKPWNRMKASLMHNYFYSPWAGASTIGAIILLILTAIQTVLAFTSGVK